MRKIVVLQKIRSKCSAETLREFRREARWVWTYVRRYRGTVAVHILIGLLSTAMGLGSSVASKYLIDAVTGQKAGSIGTAAAAMAGMILAGIALRSFSSLIGAKLNIRVQNEIQAEVFRKILRTAWKPLEQYRSGDLLSRLTSDAGAVAGGVTSFAPGFLTGAAQFVGALLIMLYYDPTMALIALIAVPVSALLSRLLVGRMREHNKQTKAISSDVMSFYEDSLSSLTSIRAFGIMDLFDRRMRRLQERYRGEFLDYTHFSVRTSAFLSLMGAAASAGCFGWGVYRLWHGAITYGSLTMFLQLASALSSSFSSLISPSGEGKTTMLRMILGHIAPKRGTAELDCEGTCYPLSIRTRSAFAYVPQGNSMFAGTIRDNLLLTCPGADDAALDAALHTACAYNFVHALPGGLDYPVGGRGKGLSEGQAQRLAIARALLGGAPILLLDEATSALDEATEEQLLRNLMQSSFVHTCIFVTHRPATAEICSRRYRVADGIVREERG